MEETIFDLKEGALVFASNDREGGGGPKAIVFREWRAEPLDLDSLDLYLDNSKEITLDINLKIKNSFKFENGIRTPITKEYSEKISLDFNFENRIEVFCIVPGGWLPINIGMTNSRVLGDRNFISRIKQYFLKNDIKQEYRDNLLADFNEMCVQIDILPYAMEGNENNFLTFEQITQQISEARTKVNEILPDTPIVQYQDIELDCYVKKLIDYLRPTIELRGSFLKNVQSLLLNPSPNIDKIIDKWEKIIDVADQIGISRKDIVVICSLLIISSPQDDSPIRNVLKPHSEVDSEKVYNALFDINLIELLLNKSKDFPDKNYVVVTSDKPLVRLASLMVNLKHKQSDGNISTFTSSIPIKYIGTDERLHTKLNEILS
ncbi:hypothetical protein MMO38_09495 [Acinetobacter sp. NIPH 1852]|uniref:hypothetical protein n=1 Tax=Acinetobacter sp. NIPH 1852 TaxID=2923428 RepID=UPI001F4B95B0|nr:hypothetical protein [Acinetobacter sp. NIPH 1852]MCH7308369.1 hypothetical protein [Acinetobacter sp. NIPH 1852]